MFTRDAPAMGGLDIVICMRFELVWFVKCDQETDADPCGLVTLGFVIYDGGRLVRD